MAQIAEKVRLGTLAEHDLNQARIVRALQGVQRQQQALAKEEQELVAARKVASDALAALMRPLQEEMPFAHIEEAPECVLPRGRHVRAILNLRRYKCNGHVQSKRSRKATRIETKHKLAKQDRLEARDEERSKRLAPRRSYRQMKQVLQLMHPSQVPSLFVSPAKWQEMLIEAEDPDALQALIENEMALAGF